MSTTEIPADRHRQSETPPTPEPAPAGSAYEPAAVEQKWYRYWEDGGFFHADPEAVTEGGKAPFVIPMPPPNVTGRLHMGHGLQDTVQDLLIRYKRMQGFEALWIPGIDHAGIATQNVVEKALKKDGVRRKEIGRQAFLEHVWDWKEQYGDIILQQKRRLGDSADWRYQRFTMDEGLSRAVQHVFVTLHQQGLVYRGEYLVNWDPDNQTVISNEEVDNVERPGSLWTVRYPVVDADGQPTGQHVDVATTRPETIPADTAVAVHPDDPRFTDLVGQSVRVPTTDRLVPIVADEQIKQDFGAGALKVTPGHSEIDWEIGKRHGLPTLSIMNLDGTLNELAGAYAGLDRKAGQSADRRRLGRRRPVGQDRGLHRHDAHLVAVQGRHRAAALAPVVRLDGAPGREGAGRRQRRDRHVPPVALGQRVPPLDGGHPRLADLPPTVVGAPDPGVVPRRRGRRARRRRASWSPSTRPGRGTNRMRTCWTRGSRRGCGPSRRWAGRTTRTRIKAFYPGSVLVSGYDILFFWIARMVMAGTHFTGQVPFTDVFITGMIKDKQGRWMSKSLGNGIDPLDMIETYGADAVRYTLAKLCAQGQDIKLDPAGFEGGRNFANKLWNASRVFGRFVPRDDSGRPTGDLRRQRDFADLDLAERWLLTRLHETVQATTEALDKYRISEAAQLVYDFVWRDFCDWYLEVSKAPHGQEPSQETLALSTEVFEQILQLLHPFMPFVTEELWWTIRPRQPGDACIASDWPAPPAGETDAQAAATFATVQGVVTAVRQVRAQYNVPPGQDVTAVVLAADAETAGALDGAREYVERLAGLSDLTVGADLAAPTASAAVVVEGHTVHVPLAGMIDLDVERARLQKEIEGKAGFLAGVERKLQNESFTSRAPQAVVDKERQKASDAQAEIAALQASLAELG